MVKVERMEKWKTEGMRQCTWIKYAMGLITVIILGMDALGVCILNVPTWNTILSDVK